MFNSKKDVFVILGVGLASSWYNFVRVCHEKGISVLLITEFRFTPDMENYEEFKKLYEDRVKKADIVYKEKGLNEEKILSLMSDIDKKYNIKALFTSIEDYVEVSAKVASIYGLKGPGLKASTISRNKILQRMLLKEKEINTPEFLVSNSLSSAQEFFKRYNPIVIKPHNQAASYGVKKITNENELIEYFEKKADQYLLLEQYISGREVSVECIVQNNKVLLTNITNKGKGEEPYFVETMQMVPANLPNEIKVRLSELGSTIVDVTEMDSGILHLEVLIENSTQKLYPVEFAVREPGQNILDLINWHYDEEAISLLIDAMHGNAKEIGEHKNAQRIAVTAYVDFPEGEIVEIRQTCDLLDIEGVKEFDFLGAVGDYVYTAKSNYDPIASLIIFAERKEQMNQILEQVDQSFSLIIRTKDGIVEAKLTKQIKKELQYY